MTEGEGNTVPQACNLLIFVEKSVFVLSIRADDRLV